MRREIPNLILYWSDEDIETATSDSEIIGGVKSRGRVTRTEQMMIAVGEPAPDVSLPADDGRLVSLKDLRGKKVVLYFYPKDDTPGCTTQACGIRDAYGEFERAGAVVLGISPDDERSHTKFKDKYGLPFTLLADPDHAVAEAYGVWAEKSRYGRTYMGIVRSTFVIAPDGTIQKVMRNVKPATHADDVLAELAAAA